MARLVREVIGAVKQTTWSAKQHSKSFIAQENITVILSKFVANTVNAYGLAALRPATSAGPVMARSGPSVNKFRLQDTGPAQAWLIKLWIKRLIDIVYFSGLARSKLF